MIDWTKSTPSANGFYWLRCNGETEGIVRVYDIEDGLIEWGAMIAWTGTDQDTSLCKALEKWDCEWFGPLLPPISA